jgi:hypothetical protein
MYIYTCIHVVYVKILVFNTTMQHPVAMCRSDLNITFSFYTQLRLMLTLLLFILNTYVHYTLRANWPCLDVQARLNSNR